MSSARELRKLVDMIAAAETTQRGPLERFRAELDFAVRMTVAHPERAEEWTPLLERSAKLVAEGLRGGETQVASLVARAEEILAPLGAAAKEYVIYCAGHAHIDMNWMWTWPETVSVCYDTFTTMDRLMDEFPEFHFSQSQASVYLAVQQYTPELFERIKQRVAEGRWEVTASQWVEGDKNLAAGETLCRHLLYTRRWFAENMGVPPDRVKLDWECDTFGHCWTLPGILRRGGVTRYYHHRSSGPQLRAMASGETSQLYWWQGKDGSRLLAFDDSPNGYNNEIAPRMTHLLFDLERHTGLKMMLWIYGVGNHGGGPTRRHLRAAQDMATWPIFPQVRLTTTDEFFTAAEREIEARGLELPVHDGELNFVFEGCYTTESRIKFANRRGECDLVDTEAIALLARNACGMEYPAQTLQECWRRTMFLQFHDILPGSGVRDTVEHAMGLFQENLANTGMIRTRSLRALAERVDTSALASAPDAAPGDMGLGAGAGDGAWWGGVSTLGAGAVGGDPFIIFNPAPFVRDEMARVKVWNREPGHTVTVRDADGNVTCGQVVERGNYWGHSFAVVAFPAHSLPALGYRAYVIEQDAPPCEVSVGAYVRETGRPLYGLGYVHAQPTNPVVMGNEHLELTISGEEGGITRLVDKATGVELDNLDACMGGLLRQQEAPHAMTAWQLGPIVEEVEVLRNCVMEIIHQGPNVAAVCLSAKHNDSEYRLTISLAAGSRQVEFDLDVNWLERGDPQTGVPVLRAFFTAGIENSTATFEIACGTIERPADGEEAPALNWVDLTGSPWDTEDVTVGLTLLNDSKYGHRLDDDTIELTLLRSSYDPDPLPELGRHHIRYALVPHVGPLDVGAAIRAGRAFNHPLIPVGTTVHSGQLPPEVSALEVLTPNVMLSGLKQAEDSDAVVLRLYEFAGERTEARVRLSPLMIAAPGAQAVETDLLEQPIEGSTARMEGDTLVVTVPACGIATVRVGG